MKHFYLDIPNKPPAVLTLTSMAVREGQDICLVCSVSQVKDPDVSWGWFCGKQRLPSNRVEQTRSTSKFIFRAEMNYHQQYCYCKLNQSLFHYTAYSNAKKLTITCKWSGCKTQIHIKCLKIIKIGVKVC